MTLFVVRVKCHLIPFANDPYAEKYDDLPKMAYHRPHRTVEHLIPVFRCPTERSIGRYRLSPRPRVAFCTMNEILKLAFKRAADVMSDAEQEAFGQWLLNALDQDERRWDKAFADPSTKLASIADEVLRDFRGERAEPFDIEKRLPHEP